MRLEYAPLKKCERKYRLMIDNNQPRIRKKLMPSLKGAYLKASATVEGAIVIPIVLFAILTIIYLLQIVAIETRINAALFETARRCSSYAYIYENVKEDAHYLNSLSTSTKSSLDNTNNSNTQSSANTIKAIAMSGINDGIFLGMFIDNLGSDFASKNHIVGGNAGFVLLRSSILNNNSKIKVCLDYVIDNPFDIFGFSLVKKKTELVTDGWLGEDKDAFEEFAGDEDDDYVYITKDGEVYHRDASCTYLTRDVLSSSFSNIENVRNQSGAKYYPCDSCKAEINSGTVYYTSYGTRYHNSEECSQLHRDILRVPLSSVANRRPCSKCAGE
ncbi:hypothetical protein SAMN05216544_1964 [Lachnospira pectinoschiza]|uniref:TadE-like protein n=2 Tax=Lachnospira pectinoschiza TaxID=28052 RepID=A0A1G9YWJ6_9FIRM|nr:hypothetical protein SAMN05216544_1964 [Lachnospira pectinoschiza]